MCRGAVAFGWPYRYDYGMTLAGIDNALQDTDNDGMPTKRNRPNVVLRVEERMLNRWKEAATADDRDLSSLIRKAVNSYVGELVERGDLAPDTDD